MSASRAYRQKMAVAFIDKNIRKTPPQWKFTEAKSRGYKVNK